MHQRPVQDIHYNQRHGALTVRRGSPTEAAIEAQRGPGESFGDALTRTLAEALERLEGMPEPARLIFFQTARAEVLA